MEQLVNRVRIEMFETRRATTCREEGDEIGSLLIQPRSECFKRTIQVPFEREHWWAIEEWSACPHDMKNHIFEGRISVMAMVEPTLRNEIKFH